MMQTLNEAAMTYVWNAIWQSILLLLVAELTVRLLKSMRAAVTHRVWVGCFLLALMLPAAPLLSRVGATASVRDNTANTLVQEASAPILHSAVILDAPTLGFEGMESTEPLREGVRVPRRIEWAMIGLRVLRLLYFASILFALLKLGSGVWRTILLQRRARTAHLSTELQVLWDACCKGFGRDDIRLLSSDDVVSPATMTLWRPVVVLPSSLHDAGSEMAAAFCHELAHVQRGDFLKNLLYELLAAPLFFHPAVWWMRQRMQETRELACDDLAAEFLDGRSAYAGSLVRLAESMTASPAVAAGRTLGVFEGDVLEKRVMNLIEMKVKQTSWRIAASIACGVVLLTGSCVVSARFGLRPVFAASVQRMQPVVKAVASAPAKAADVMAGLEKSAAPETATVASDNASTKEEASEYPLPSEIASLQPGPVSAAPAEPEAEAPQSKATDSITYSGTPPKYPNPGDLKPVSFKLRKAKFEPGDSITIDELRGTSDKVVEGNLYQIKGHYTLSSHDDALLAASVTTSRDTKSNGGSPSLNMSVNKGDGQFTLWLFMGEHGSPHLSFYPSAGGSSFASVYFETGDGSPQSAMVADPAQSAEAATGVPHGWVLMGDAPQRYRTGIDAQMQHAGMPSAFLASKTKDEFKGFGTLGQNFRGSAYLGKRIRLRGWVRSEGVMDWAGLWMRVDVGTGRDQKSASFDNMQNRAIKGTTGWTMYDIVLDVSKDASGIGMGILLSGPGEVWLSGVTIEIVPKTVPTTETPTVTPDGPVNLGFGH